MPSCTSFYLACPLDNLAATSTSLLSKGFKPEFVNPALLDKGPVTICYCLTNPASIQTERHLFLPYCEARQRDQASATVNFSLPPTPSLNAPSTTK
jgi:hypothetical protein